MRCAVQLLLTSSGITNPTIHDALEDLLGKPVAESSALFVPTGMYPFPGGGQGAMQAIRGDSKGPLCGLGWKSLALLELTALTSVQPESWIPTLQETDALLVWGGNVGYLCYWMRCTGLADLLPSLQNLVYVGVSAGSIAMTPYNCDAEWNRQFFPPDSDIAQGLETGLGLVDFALCVHLDNPDPIFEDNSMVNIARWAAGVPASTYAIDDQSAVKVIGDAVEVVSEAKWRLFTPTGGLDG
jgi:dipeptidase E